MSGKNLTPQPLLEGKGRNEKTSGSRQSPPKAKRPPKKLAETQAAASRACCGCSTRFGGGGNRVLRLPSAKRCTSGVSGANGVLAVPIAKGDNQPVAKVKPVIIRVKGDRWTYVVDANEKHYALALRWRQARRKSDLVQLDRDGQPTAFVLRGIYAIEGDRAKIQIAPDPEPATDRIQRSRRCSSGPSGLTTTEVPHASHGNVGVVHVRNGVRCVGRATSAA